MEETVRTLVDLADRIIERRREPDGPPPFDQLVSLAAEQPRAIAPFARRIFDVNPKQTVFFDAALELLPEDEWPELVAEAIPIYERDNGHQAANSLLGQAALRQPAALHPYLDRLFAIGSATPSFYLERAWRGAGPSHGESLLSTLRDPAASAFAVHLAWVAGLETREEPLIRRMIPLADRAREARRSIWPHDPSKTAIDTEYFIAAYLEQVGLEQADEGLRRLDPEPTYHLVAIDGPLVEPSRLGWENRHPTWARREPIAEAQFGGDASETEAARCAACQERLQRLITFKPGGLGLGLGVRLESLEIAACLRCVGWLWPGGDPFHFYHHDEAGRPHNITPPVDSELPEWTVGPLEVRQLQLVETPPPWRVQDWGMSNSRQNLNRIGGQPTWVQDAEYAACPKCRKTMKSLVQFDTALPLADGDSFEWGSGGLGYVQWCDTCRISAVFWQCT